MRDRADFGCFVECGAYPHLELEDDGHESAAVQDGSVGTFVLPRPGYERKEALFTALEDALN